MKILIEESHKRSESYGINRKDRDLDHAKLSRPELEARRLKNKDILEVIVLTIKEFCDLMSPDDFLVGFADNEGYILHLAGSDEPKVRSTARKFAPGYRWTERDVGTTATSLCLRLEVSIQLNNTTVLLLGETGTGKELFAQAIHNGNKGDDKPFVPINCGAIPGELLESELFGYAEGAFTGAQKGGRSGKFILANGGTILLDEIGDMPPDMQVKLLRVLQTGEVHPVGARKVLQTSARTLVWQDQKLEF